MLQNNNELFSVTARRSVKARLPTEMGIKGAKLQAILQAAKHAGNSYNSATPVTNVTICTDSQDAFSDCRHSIKVCEPLCTYTPRHHIPTLLNHNIDLPVAWVPTHSGIRGNGWAPNEARTALR